MRILHVTNTYLPVRNGVTISVAGWARGLRQAGHEVSVWTVAGAQATTDEAVVASPGLGSIAYGFPVPLSAFPPRALWAHDWDVVHVHHPVLLGPSAARFARLKGVPLVATAHSDYVAYLDSYTPALARLLRPPATVLMRNFFNRADLVLAPCDGIASSLRAWGVSTPIAGVSYAVDIGAFRPKSRTEARSRLGIPLDTPLALYAGRLAEDKSVPALLGEFATTRRLLPEARLAIVGTGPLEGTVRRLAGAAGGSVTVTGALGQEELGLWYSAADVFVSASRNEVGPLATIEAALFETPTAATASPGFVDRVKDGVTGRLSGAGPGALGQVLAGMLGDPQGSRNMGLAARRLMSEHTMQASTERLVALYADLAKIGRVASPARRRSRRPRLRADAE